MQRIRRWHRQPQEGTTAVSTSPAQALPVIGNRALNGALSAIVATRRIVAFADVFLVKQVVDVHAGLPTVKELVGQSQVHQGDLVGLQS